MVPHLIRALLPGKDSLHAIQIYLNRPFESKDDSCNSVRLERTPYLWTGIPLRDNGTSSPYELVHSYSNILMHFLNFNEIPFETFDWKISPFRKIHFPSIKGEQYSVVGLGILEQLENRLYLNNPYKSSNSDLGIDETHVGDLNRIMRFSSTSFIEKIVIKE